MGTLCLEHEQERQRPDRVRLTRSLPRVAKAAALIAAGAAGALIRTRLAR